MNGLLQSLIFQGSAEAGPARRGDPRSRSHVAFTMVELTAVVAIIAILSLLIVPAVRNRVRQARIVAAQTDMEALSTAETLARGEADQYFRLSDLDNRRADPDEVDAATTPTAIAAAIITVPNTYWNRTIVGFFNTAPASAVSHRIVTRWNGPYTQYPSSKSLPLETLQARYTPAFRVWDGTTSVGDGPMLILTDDLTVTGTLLTDDDDFDQAEAHPTDPWDSPYLFFGDEPVGNAAGAINGSVTEVNFGLPILYSMGPNAVPGADGSTTDSLDYFRETGLLGTGDDIQRVF